MTTATAPEPGIYYDVPYEEYNLWPYHRKSHLFILDELTLAHYKWAVDHPEDFHTADRGLRPFGELRKYDGCGDCLADGPAD